MSVLNGNQKSASDFDDGKETSTTTVVPPADKEKETSAESPGHPAEVRLKDFATRTNLEGTKQGGNKAAPFLLGGAVVVALLFLLFAQLGTGAKKIKPQSANPTETQKQPPVQPNPPASHVPIMDEVNNPPAEQAGDTVSPSDIERTRKPNYETGANSGAPHTPINPPSRNLGSVPPFKDTQQSFENPSPYGAVPRENAGNTATASAAQQEQNVLKEASLVYVKSAQQGFTGSSNATPESDAPVLQLEEGTRISARLDTQISTAIHAPVVAIVEYTYAIGNQVLVPAGARVYGKLTQADSSGLVGVDFNEIELLDGAREKITAIGEGLDLGPIRGNVYGQHNGRNFLIRAMSGLGSAASMLVGNNSGGAYSMDDVIRERAADNIGMAADTQLMQLNANSHITVSVPANTRFYIVWTARPKSTTAQKSSTQASVVPPLNTTPQ